MGYIINAFTRLRKWCSSTTSASATYRDLDVAAAIILRVRENQLIAPFSEHHCGPGGRSPNVRACRVVCVYPPRQLHVRRISLLVRHANVCRPLEVLECLQSCLPMRGPWVIAMLGEAVGSKGQVRSSHCGDPHRSPRRLPVDDAAHLLDFSIPTGARGHSRAGPPPVKRVWR